jgi:hypothetical protein
MTDVRAITVKQPWAWAIALGGKTVENRSRGTSYRGTLLIHAGKGWSERGASDVRVLTAWRDPWHDQRHLVVAPELVPLGAVIAVAQLVDSHPDADCCRPWGESEYSETSGRRRTVVHHLVLENVVPLAEPVPCPGALGLWRPPHDVVLQCGGATVGGTR